MGISSEAPLYAAIEGSQAGETFNFNGLDIKIETVI